ncbi:putative porin [Colwellia sp. D2M02]|uniref:putative porin n=1 Tax=Colwellia sp. D2M02 TaxID=2841562 RepID=UPI001C0996E3|nr:putative porin [Colwellia sp. D2M02]MBU2893076.1 putative porin [Colwellia sp. D2M02]
MKLSALAVLIPSLLLGHSLQASAQDYQSFSGAGYSLTDEGDTDTSMFNLNSRYYFDGRAVLGPLNQFKFIEKISNISVGYQYNDSDIGLDYGNGQSSYFGSSNTHNLSASGEWFTGDFLIGGGYSYADSEVKVRSNDTYNTSYSRNSDAYFLTAGYLFSDDLLVKVNVNKYEGESAYVTMSASYNWQLGDVDYVGFTYSTDEDLDFHNLSAKYFMGLANESYLVMGADYIYDNSGDYEDDSWNANVNYYFNTKTSVSASYGNDESYSVGANHYFNKNYALGAYYASSNDTNDYDTYGVNFTAQF